MADVIDFKTRVVKEDPRPDLFHRANVLTLACTCGSTLCELASDGVITCARCRRPAADIRWSFITPPPDGGRCA